MGTGVTVAGFSGNVADVGGTTFRALKVSARPSDYASLGSYRKSMSSTTSAVLGSTILMFGFLRTSGSNRCVVNSFTMDGCSVGATAYSSAGAFDLSASLRRDATALGGAATLGTFTGNNGKLRTSMATSSGASMAIATGIASITLTGGNGPLTQLAFYSSIYSTAVAVPIFPKVDMLGGRRDIILLTNECITAEMADQGGAAGSLSYGFTVAWTEVTSY